MTPQRIKAMHWQFSLRGLFVCVLITGLCGGWWVDHHRLQRKVDEQTATLEEWDQKMRRLQWAAHSNPPPRIDDVMRLLGVDSGGRIQTRDWYQAEAEQE